MVQLQLLLVPPPAKVAVNLITQGHLACVTKERKTKVTKFINVSDASCPFWPDVPCLSFRFEFLSIVFMGLHLFLVEVPTVPAKMNILTTVKALDLLG